MAQELQHEKCVLWRIESNYRIPPFQVKFNQNRWDYRFRFFLLKSRKVRCHQNSDQNLKKIASSKIYLKNAFTITIIHIEWKLNAKIKSIEGQSQRRFRINRTPYNLRSSCVILFFFRRRTWQFCLYNFYRWTKTKEKVWSIADARSSLWCVCVCFVCFKKNYKRLQFTKSVVRFKSIEIKMSP